MTIMEGVTEYAEGYPVELIKKIGIYESATPVEKWVGHGRLVIQALNEGGNNCTSVDVLELIAWLRTNRPDLL